MPLCYFSGDEIYRLEEYIEIQTDNVELLRERAEKLSLSLMLIWHTYNKIVVVFYSAYQRNAST